jgi:hypothetical protein
LERWRQARRAADSYGLLLIVIILQFLLMPLLDGWRWGPTVQTLFLGAMLLLAARTSRVHRHFLHIAQAMVVVAVVLVTVDNLFGDNPNDLISFLLGSLVVVTPFIILRRIMRHPVIDAQTVLGAICTYLLIGLTFAFVYHAIYSLDPESFKGELGNSALAGLAYFSFVTLAPLGYGDIVPVTEFGRMTAALEALLGQIFLVTLVAALVGNLGRQRRSVREADLDPELRAEPAPERGPQPST